MFRGYKIIAVYAAYRSTERRYYVLTKSSQLHLFYRVTEKNQKLTFKQVIRSFHYSYGWVSTSSDYKHISRFILKSETSDLIETMYKVDDNMYEYITINKILEEI